MPSGGVNRLGSPPDAGIKLIVIDLNPNRFGIWVTLEQTDGVAQPYIWEVFTEE